MSCLPDFNSGKISALTACTHQLQCVLLKSIGWKLLSLLNRKQPRGIDKVPKQQSTRGTDALLQASNRSPCFMLKDISTLRTRCLGLKCHFLKDTQDFSRYWQWHLFVILTSHLLHRLCSIFALLPLTCFNTDFASHLPSQSTKQFSIWVLPLQFCYPSHWQLFPLFSYL